MSWREWLAKLFMVVAVTAFVGAVAFAQTSVSAAPATKNVLPGTSFSLTFSVANVPPIHGYHVDVDYDNTILQYNGATSGTFLPPFLWLPTPSGPHTIYIATALVGNGTSVSGSGTLFTMQFTAIGAGVSPITLTTVELRNPDNSGNISPVTINPGSVTVGNPGAVYVNSTYTSGSAGGHDFGYDAFNVVANGVSAVNSGGTVNIASATYNESISITKDMTLTGVGNPTIQNLTVNTTSVTIGGNFQVSGVLTLTSGVVTTGANKITITNDQPGGVVITNGSIAGEICRTIAAGNTGEYFFTNKYSKIKPDPAQPLTTVCVVAYPNTYPPSAPAGRAMNRYYTIVTSPADFSAESLYLEFLPSENINSIPRPSWAMFKRDGAGPWQAVGSVPDFTNYFVVAGAINSWSAWTIGNTVEPLPIQLASFTGRLVNQRNVLLDWTTLSEINNYGFEVQKSNGTAFTSIPNSFVAGHGTTNIPHSYSFTDVNAAHGNWFYRLKQIDLDGTEHFTEPVIVNITTDVGESSTPTQFKLEQNYPNPFNPSTTIGFTVPVATHVTLEVFNTLGEKVTTLLSQQMNTGRHTVDWKADEKASGLYIVRLTAAGFVASQKILLSK